MLETVAQRLEAVAKVAKVDTERSPKLAARSRLLIMYAELSLGNMLCFLCLHVRYQIEALPTMILFANGQVVERIVGYYDANDLEKKVRDAITRYNAGKSL